jgi:anaerobic magnesium-protoporphyrin IX monomethyl ester cyclase
VSRQLDVLFVIPGDLAQVYQTFAREHHTEPPAKARQMIAYLLRRNYGVELLDATILGLTPEQMAAKVLEADPRLVWIPVYGFNPSSSTHTMPAARRYAEEIKKIAPGIPIVMSGTHPAAVPKKTLDEEPIDYVCSGEGPVTAHELLQALASGGDVDQVGSLWHRKEGHMVRNRPAALLDLNEEPALAGWAYMDPRRYHADGWHTFYRPYAERAGYANPFSAEGCPFHCDFCNIQSPFRDGEMENEIRKKGLPMVAAAKPRNSYRFLRPELFVDEVTYLVENYGVKYFKIPDEMFALNEAHVLRIANLIAERHGDSLDFWCYARVDTADKPRMLEACRRAGIMWFGLGIEAADSKVRSGQDKKFEADDIYRVVGNIHAAGIYVGANFIFGLPGDTRESMQASYDLACSLNARFANFYCTQALPGSALYEEAQKSGYPLPERPGGPGWIGHSQYAYESEPYYAGTALTPAEIIAFRDRSHVGYFTRPEFRASLLADPKFGQVALDSIDRWVDGVRGLRRKLLEEQPASAR